MSWTDLDPVEVARHIGTCPACSERIYADVDLVTAVNTPGFDNDGRPRTYTTTTAIAARINHSCKKGGDE